MGKVSLASIALLLTLCCFKFKLQHPMTSLAERSMGMEDDEVTLTEEEEGSYEEISSRTVPLKIPTAEERMKNQPDMSLLEKVKGVETRNFTFDPSKIPRTYDMDEDPAPLLKLTDANFTSYIKENQRVMVFFYNSKCTECRNMYSHYKDGAKMLQSASASSTFVVVNGDNDTELVKRLEITRYPTYYYYDNGLVDFPTKFSPVGATGRFTEWVLKNEFPLTFMSESDFDLERAKMKTNMGNIILIAFVVKGSKKEKFIETLAENARDELTMHFAVVHIHDKKESRVEIHKRIQRFVLSDDDDVITYRGDANRVWHEADLLPLAKTAYQRTIQQDFDPELHALDNGVLAVIHLGNDRNFQKYAEIFEPIAQDYLGKINFTFIIPENYQRESAILGISSSVAGFYVIVCDATSGNTWQKQGPIKFKYSEEFEEDAIREFLTQWENGGIEPYLRNTAFTPQDDRILHITADSFEFTALNPHTITFVMYYSPNDCERCLAELGVWRELHNAVNKSPSLKEKVLIALMNVAANEMVDTDVSTVPAYVIYPAGNEILRRRKSYTSRLRVPLLIEYLEAVIEDTKAMESEQEEL